MWNLIYWTIAVLSLPISFLSAAALMRYTCPSDEDYEDSALLVLLANSLAAVLISFAWHFLIPILIIIGLLALVAKPYAVLVNKAHALLTKKGK